MTDDDSPTLVVFSDDWGRHPSSCQHLVRHLLPTHAVVWVNTIGMRRVRLTAGDLARITGVVANWLVPYRRDDEQDWPANLRVVSPKMYPGFRRRWQRGFNARRMAGAVDGELRSRKRRERVAVTTLPITADLVGKLDVDRWVYYCVDDFSVWPGLDGRVMDAMERELVAKVDAVVCVSEVLRERIRAMGREADLLTHGVDLAHWATPDVRSHIPQAWPEDDRPIILFWGLLDLRLEVEWLWELELADAGRTVLAGPAENAVLLNDLRTTRLGPTPYRDLPALAAASQVLIMPYIDAPVTRAMQPLKLLEYLATYKPVVVRDLPATREWADCCDVVSTAEEFVRVCLERAETGLPASQRAAREGRLPGESWSEKARCFAKILHDFSPMSR